MVPSESPPYINMFFRPLKVFMKVTSMVMVVEKADVVTVVAPMLHWLFCRVTVELTGLRSAPLTLSHSKET